MRLNHNLQSLNVYRNLLRTEKKQSVAMNRINTGSKLNSAADDPNRISQSERLKLGIRSLNSCSRNIQDSVSLIQTMDGGLSGMSESLQRIRELTVQAGGMMTEKDKEEIKKEINVMVDNINYLAKNTDMNGLSMLNRDGIEGTPDYIISKISMEDDDIKIPTFQLTTDKLGIEKEQIDISTVDKVGESLEKIDSAMEKVITARSSYGSIQNRLESTFDIVQDTVLAMEGADSMISDADVAEEILNLTTKNIITEASNAIMVQTNRMPSEVLNILRNMK
ncbi:flagellin [Hathewaya proteolytica DSM 3090]|uniref:Flagellin n=1 Tax=Hathewaya proteolytica DSM 3090 TaxID=1121331 RepID=A0A1M6LB86_9CLOT|nr:flagellin [Hathewaya proteolytica]SHJ68419.1 flagellin [Hathewaya proteolytica DSM 3090]